LNKISFSARLDLLAELAEGKTAAEIGSVPWSCTDLPGIGRRFREESMLLWRSRNAKPEYTAEMLKQKAKLLAEADDMCYYKS